MEWISVKDKLPDDHDAHYVVAVFKYCKDCENDVNHCHRLNYKSYRIDTASWGKADIPLVKYYEAKGDTSWGFCSCGHFCDTSIDSKDITHWLKLPKLFT